MTQQILSASQITVILTGPVSLPDTAPATHERISTLENALTDTEHGTADYWATAHELNALRVHLRMLRGLAAR